MERTSTNLLADRRSIWAVKNEKMPDGRTRSASFDTVQAYRHWVETEATPTLRQLYNSVQLEARHCQTLIPDMRQLTVCGIVLRNRLENFINQLCEMAFSFKTWDLRILIDHVCEQIRLCLEEMRERMHPMRLNSLRRAASHCQKCREQPYIARQNAFTASNPYTIELSVFLCLRQIVYPFLPDE